ncbi:MAG TPA: ABC transporter permease [Chthoniobacterales bacterium]
MKIEIESRDPQRGALSERSSSGNRRVETGAASSDSRSFAVEKFNPRRLLALIRKEGVQILRDPSSILIAFILPVILLFLFGYAVSLDSTKLRVGVVMEERTPVSESLMAALRDSKYFTVTPGFTLKEMEDQLVAGKLRGILVIPVNFSRLFTGNNGGGDTAARLQIIADGSEPNTASFVQNYIRAAIGGWQTARALDQGANAPPNIEIETRMWFNPSLESKNYLVPGSIAIVMTLIGTLLTSLVVAREWERGTMEALMATPVSIQELVLGKLIPYFLLGFGSMSFCTLVSVGIFHTPLRGSAIVLALVTSAFLAACLGQGLFISTLAKSQFIAGQAALILGFLPSFQLSGFIFEIRSMPAPIQALTYLFPARYFVQALHTIFLAGDVGAVLWRDGLILVGFAAVFFLLTSRVTRKKLD